MGRLMHWLRVVPLPPSTRCDDGLAWAIKVWCNYSDHPIRIREIPEVIDTIPVGGRHLEEILRCSEGQGMKRRKFIAGRAVKEFRRQR